MLRGFYGEVDYLADGQWVRLPSYRLPAGVFNCEEAALAFQIPAGYPGQGPYAFYIHPSIKLADGTNPNNFEENAATAFGAGWCKFSWQVEPWVPKASAVAGDNLVTFVRSCGHRLREGR